MSRKIVSPYFRRDLRGGLVVAGLATVMTTTAVHAADVMPMDGIDARSRGRIAPAETTDAGALHGGVSLRAADKVSSSSSVAGSGSVIDDQTTAPAAASSVRRASAFVNYGLAERFELGLGLHGSQEQISDAGVKARLVEENGGEETSATGFSGASLVARVGLVKSSNFAVSLLPFIESGTGKIGQGSLSRGEASRTGFILATSLGSSRVGSVTLNAGMRYRTPEIMGNLELRNEAFAGLEAKADLAKSFGVFVAGTTRRIMVRDVDQVASADGRKWQPAAASEVSGGIELRTKSANFNAFAGSSVGKASVVTGGRMIAGLGVSFALGKVSGSRGDTNFAAEKEAPKAKPAPIATAPKSEPSKIAGMNETEIDPLADLEPANGEDDFAKIQARMKAEEKNAGPTRTDLVEKELSGLRAAEDKASAERMKAEQAERDLKRKEALQRAAGVRTERSKWEKEAKAEADSLDGITNDELDWQGLE